MSKQRLFNEFLNYTEYGNKVSIEIERAVQSILEKYTNNFDFHDLQTIAYRGVSIATSLIYLDLQHKALKEREKEEE